MSIGCLRPDWPAPESVRALVTVRGGGSSAGAYSSMNLAMHVGDDPRNVERNRRRLRGAFELPAEPEWLEQVHGTRVIDLDADDGDREADAAVTRSAGVVCAVMTADCVPLLLTDTAGRIVGVAHAGWRGLAAGVVDAAVAAMAAPPAELLAWIGPAICAAHYEVGGEVRDALAAAFERADAALRPNGRGRWQADLAALTRMSLESAGVTRVFGAPPCTYGDEDRFFSHRREAPCGRIASLIWRDPAA